MGCAGFRGSEDAALLPLRGHGQHSVEDREFRRGAQDTRVGGVLLHPQEVTWIRPPGTGDDGNQGEGDVGGRCRRDDRMDDSG